MNLISGGALALLERPDQLARVRDDPAVIRSGVEEMLRYVCPVQLTGRVALEEMEVGGATIAAGEFSMLLLASANRDPDAFDDPDTFDVARTENNHLGFGFGIHHCLGAPLARLEAQIALPTLFRRARRLERTSDDALLQGEHRASGSRVPSRSSLGLSPRPEIARIPLSGSPETV